MKSRYFRLIGLAALVVLSLTNAQARLVQDSFYEYYDENGYEGYMYIACSGARTTGGTVTAHYDVYHTPCGDPEGGSPGDGDEICYDDFCYIPGM